MLIEFPWQLVRDHVVDAAEHDGARCIFKQCSGEKYRNELGKKLVLLATELQLAKDPQQRESTLADLLDVLSSYQTAHLIRPIEVAEVQKRKTMLRGGFSLGIKLYCILRHK